MIPFGFGVSDFIAVGQLAAKIAKALSDNTGAATYASLIALLQSIFVLVGQITSYLSSSPLTVQIRLDTPTLNALRYHLECSQHLMTQFLADSKNYTESILKAKSSGIKAQLRKIQWAVFKGDDARILEQRLQTHLDAAQIFLSVIISKSQSEASHSHFEIATRTESKIDVLTRKLDQVLVCRETTERNIPHTMGYPWETETPIFFEDVFGRCHRLPEILCHDVKMFCNTLRLLFRSMVDHDGIGRWEDYEVVNDSTNVPVLNRRDIEYFDAFCGTGSNSWDQIAKPGKKLAMNIVRTQKLAAKPDALIPLLPKDRNCPKCGTFCPGTKLSRCRSCRYAFGICVKECPDYDREFFSQIANAHGWSDTPPPSRPESRPNSDFRQITERLEDSHTNWNVPASFNYSNTMFPAPRSEENAFMRVRYVTQYLVPHGFWQCKSRSPLSHAVAQGNAQWAKKILSKSGTDPNGRDVESLTPLARVCRDPKGDFEAVIRLLIKHGADVNAPSFTNPLSIAAGRGDIALVGLLLRLGADASAAGSLQTACRGGHIGIVRTLLAAGAHVNFYSVGQNEATALQEACGAGHVDVVKILLAAGAYINHGPTFTMIIQYSWPLWMACKSGSTGVVKMLIDAGADVNPNIGMIPLQAACATGHLDIIRMLIAYGADVNAYHFGKGTPLQAACKSQDMTIVKLLIDTGARVNDPSKTHTGKTTLAAAIVGDRLRATPDNTCEPGDEENVLALVRYLIEQGADVNGCSDGMTALQAAAGTGQIRVLEELLRLGADVNQISLEGSTTALKAAVPNIKVMKLLLNHGASVNQTLVASRTALQAAIPNIEAMKLLLNHGASLNQTFVAGQTALQAAIPNIEAMKLLLDHGADVNAITNADDFRTALQTAAHHNHEEAVRLLVDSYGALVSAPGNRYTTLEASLEGEKFGYDIEKEAKTEAVTAFLLQRSAECTPWALGLAVMNGYLNLVKLLLEYRKAAYGKDCMVAALEDAVYLNRLTVVAYFLGRSVKPTPTCAHIAAYKGLTDILKTLLMHGAPIDKPAATVYGIERREIKWHLGWTGNTVLETALYHNRPTVIQILQEWERGPQRLEIAESSSEQGPVASRIQEVE